MFKRWRCYVALLLCLCCTFVTLSLNTLRVEASRNFSLSYTMTLYPSSSDSAVTGTINSVSGGSGSIYNGTGTISSVTGGGGSIMSGGKDYYNYHVRLPVTFAYPVSDLDSNIGNDTFITYSLQGMNLSVTGGNVTNLVIYDSDGDLVYNSNSTSPIGSTTVNYKMLGDIIGDYRRNVLLNYFIEYDVSFVEDVDFYGSSLTSQCNFSTQVNCNVANQWEQNNGKNPVIDTGANDKLNQQIQQENTAQETRTGILSQITSFFGSFFENIINALKSLFIPEDGYFTNWFTRLNTLLSAKLGMLYAPFDLVISVLTALGSASTSEAGIPFPELAWDGQVIIPAQTFYFSSLGSSFSDLRDAVYFGTDVVLLFAFLVLLQRKINLVMRGSEEG